MWNPFRAQTSKPRPHSLYDGQPYFCLTCGKSLDEPHCDRHHPESTIEAMDRANRFTRRMGGASENR